MVRVHLWPGDSVKVTKGDSQFPPPYIEYEGMSEYRLGSLPTAVPHEGDILERSKIAGDRA